MGPHQDKYTLVSRIGKGSYGEVNLVSKKNSPEVFVMKVVKYTTLDANVKVEAMREVNVLRSLRHPNIVAFAEGFRADGGSKLCIVMEYCECGDLGQQIEIANKNGQYVPTETVLDWFVQLCLALKYLHSKYILHRDLKPQNAFLTDRRRVLKLGDFGITKTLDNTAANAITTIGTPYYFSPEICQNEPYGFKSDVWALGCVAYELLALRVPFRAGSLRELVHKILYTKPASPDKTRYPMAFLQLVAAMLAKSPHRRPSVAEILSKPVIEDHLRDFMERYSALYGSPDELVGSGSPAEALAAFEARRRASSSGSRLQRDVDLAINGGIANCITAAAPDEQLISDAAEALQLQGGGGASASGGREHKALGGEEEKDRRNDTELPEGQATESLKRHIDARRRNFSKTAGALVAAVARQLEGGDDDEEEGDESPAPGTEGQDDLIDGETTNSGEHGRDSPNRHHRRNGPNGAARSAAAAAVAADLQAAVVAAAAGAARRGGSRNASFAGAEGNGAAARSRPSSGGDAASEGDAASTLDRWVVPVGHRRNSTSMYTAAAAAAAAAAAMAAAAAADANEYADRKSGANAFGASAASNHLAASAAAAADDAAAAPSSDGDDEADGRVLRRHRQRQQRRRSRSPSGAGGNNEPATGSEGGDERSSGGPVAAALRRATARGNVLRRANEAADAALQQEQQQQQQDMGVRRGGKTAEAAEAASLLLPQLHNRSRRRSASSAVGGGGGGARASPDRPLSAAVLQGTLQQPPSPLRPRTAPSTSPPPPLLSQRRAKARPLSSGAAVAFVGVAAADEAAAAASAHRRHRSALGRSGVSRNSAYGEDGVVAGRSGSGANAGAGAAAEGEEDEVARRWRELGRMGAAMLAESISQLSGGGDGAGRGLTETAKAKRTANGTVRLPRLGASRFMSSSRGDPSATMAPRDVALAELGLSLFLQGQAD